MRKSSAGNGVKSRVEFKDGEALVRESQQGTIPNVGEILHVTGG